MRGEISQPVMIRAGGAMLNGDLVIPEGASGLVIFAHGSGSSRASPRNRFVAGVLREAGLGTLLFDLLTPEEEAFDERTGHMRFDIEFLTERLCAVTDWLVRHPRASTLRIGYFGASTGAAAALVAAARRPRLISAVVSRGGRPDLAGATLRDVHAATLLIVGSRDEEVIALNEQAAAQLYCEKRLDLVPHATHLFEEPGTLEEVAQLARDWFVQWLAPQPTGAPQE